MAFYKQSKERFDTEPEFKARAYSCVVKLQAHDEARGNTLEIHQPTTITENYIFSSSFLCCSVFGSVAASMDKRILKDSLSVERLD
jgi:hypothetical protein